MLKLNFEQYKNLGGNGTDLNTSHVKVKLGQYP